MDPDHADGVMDIETRFFFIPDSIERQGPWEKRFFFQKIARLVVLPGQLHGPLLHWLSWGGGDSSPAMLGAEADDAKVPGRWVKSMM